MFVLRKRLVSMVKGGLVTLLQVGVLLFFLYILLWLSLSYMLLVPYVASSCRRVLPAAAYDLSLFFIFQLLWFTWLDVFHAFLSFCVPTDKSFLYVGVYRVSCPVVGLGLGGGEARQKRGALWWRHHSQPTVIITFDLPKIHPRVCSWDYGITEIAEGENAKGCSWYTTLKTLKAGKTRLATHKS